MGRSKTTDTSNKPYVSNYPPLQEWLDKHDARCMQQIPCGDRANPAAYWESWMIGGRLCIIVVHANGHGWEIYTNDNTPKIDGALADAERRLGLTQPPPATTTVQARDGYRFFEWIAKIRIDANRVALGFNLFAHQLRSLVADDLKVELYEIETEIVAAPPDAEIAKEQGYRSVKDFIADRDK